MFTNISENRHLRVRTPDRRCQAGAVDPQHLAALGLAVLALAIAAPS